MEKPKLSKKILIYLGIFITVEVLSYFSLTSSALNQVLFAIIFLAGLGVSIYRLEYGLLVALGELLIGSMGHLYTISLGDYSVAIRMALWAAILAAFVIKFIGQLIKDKKRSRYLQSLKNFNTGKYFLLLAAFVIIGFINAWLRGHSFNLIFSDINSWFYYLLLVPAVAVYGENDKSIFNNLKTLFIAGALWLSLKTLILLYIFTHNLSIAPDIYLWLRKTLVGEMTPTLSGWPRIFIQGQIYSGLALFLTFWINLKKLKKYSVLIFGAIFSSALLISFSRSFWVALIVSIIFSLILVWRFFSLRKAVSAAIWFTLSFALGFVLLYLVAIFPYPTPGNFNADFISRVSNGNESALTSRWSLLPVLVSEIKKEPILGQGYGATITYISSDPRVLEKNPSGEYTTYAFEWGYLDLWLKIGLLGLLAYLILLFYLINNALINGRKNDDYLQFGLAVGVVFLAVTHLFTPYLNHPLGMGILIIGACLIRKDRVY